METSTENALNIIASNARGEHWLPFIVIDKVKSSTLELLYNALDDIEAKTSRAKRDILAVISKRERETKQW